MSEGSIHHRQASGLVREGKPLDAAVFNLFSATLGPVIAWILMFGVGFYPGSNVVLTIVLTLVLCVGLNLVYAIFASIMPRSGGDYIFISRTFAPWLGFAANAAFLFWICFYIGTAGAVFGEMGVGPACRVLAEATGNLDLATVGDWFSTSWGRFISGLAMLAITGPVVIAGKRGLRSYFKFQRWVFVFCGGTLLITIIALLIMPKTGFISSFNDYMSTFSGTQDAHATIVTEGGGHGAFDLEQTMLAATWPFYSVAFLVLSAFWAGESRTGFANQIKGITVPFFAVGAILIGTVGLAVHKFGADFLTGIAVVDPASYGLTSAPFFAELVAAWTGPVFGILIAFGIGAWMISYVPLLTIMVSRGMIAWSADGIMPAWLGRVNPRNSNPVNATLVTFAFGVLFLCLYSFTEAFSVVTAMLGFAITFLITCLAAIVFPYLRKENYRGSAGDKSLLGVPVLTIAGVAGTIGLIVMITVFLRDPSSGTNWPANKGQVIGIFAAIAVAAIVYWVSALSRKRRGLDPKAAFRELPPE